MDVILSEFLIDVILPALGTLVIVFVGLAARRLEQKFRAEGAESSARYKLDLARLAAQYAEEKAAAWAKRGEPVTDEKKSSTALNFFRNRMSAITEDEATELIDAILPAMGLGATKKGECP